MSNLPLNKAGNRRGMSAGSRKHQFKPKSVVVRQKPSEMTPQTRSQAKRVSITHTKGKVNIGRLPIPKKQPTPRRRVQRMIDKVYDISGKSIKKSLIGMAQSLNAPASDLLRIKNASEAELEMIYNRDQLLFEMYWEYPIFYDDDRGATLEEILVKAGV